MRNVSTTIIPYILAPAVTALFLLLMLKIAGLIDLPSTFFKWYLVALLFGFIWWPFDMLLHWEKRTPASLQKDKYIAMIAVTLILFIVPYHWLGTPLWQAIAAAFTIGVLIPSLIMLIFFIKSKVNIISPGAIYRLGMLSPRAQEFINYFPDANQYAYGMTAGEGNRGHLILHKRQPASALDGAYIDYVLDVCIDHRLGRYVGGKEQLQCYLFINNKGNAGVGFLPSANIGRALDYGFSDDEMEKAITEATSLDHQWPALKEEPLAIQHYPGKVVKIG